MGANKTSSAFVRRLAMAVVAAITALDMPARAEPPSGARHPAHAAKATKLTAAQLLKAGSQSARDDLYCAGVINAKLAQSEADEAVLPKDVAQRTLQLNMALSLAVSGTGKLIDEGVAKASETGPYADAQAARAERDLAAGKPRISVAACEKRSKPPRP